MNKKCENCKIEFTPNLIKKYFCDSVCLKAYRRNWLYKLKRNDEYITGLVERNLTQNY